MMNLIPKSRIVSLALTLFFGPLGLFYSSWVAGLVLGPFLLVVAIFTAPSVVGPVICWVLAIAIGDHCTHRHNQNIENIKALVANKG